MEKIEECVSKSNISISSRNLGLLVGFLSSNRNVVESVNSCEKLGVHVDVEAGAFVAGLLFGHSEEQSCSNTNDQDQDTKSSSTKSDVLNDKSSFAAAFDRIAADILNSLSENHSLSEEALSWVREMMYYTVPGGKMNRGVSVIDTLRIINGKSLSKSQLEDAITLGWCIELLQAFFLVADDVMDRSQTRRGKICWYRVAKVKEIAKHFPMRVPSPKVYIYIYIYIYIRRSF